MQQLTPQDIQFIKELCATYGVITNEHERIDFIKEYLESQGISTYLDFHGNLLAGNVKNPTVVLASHIDEVGVMVREIRDDGLVSVIAAGYINPSILLNSVIEFKTANGMVSGYVISDHMVSGQLGHKELHMHEVFVDVGLPSASEVMQRGITIGTLGRFERIFMEEENRIVASGLDNIVGTFINIKLLVENPELTTDYVFLFHRGEEKGSYGAETFQHRIFAPYSIVLDYFPAQVIETPIGDNFPTLDNGACVVYAA